MNEVLLPIPWNYTDQNGVLLWTWRTEHFTARISGQEVADPQAHAEGRVIRAYTWDLSDLIKLNQGMPRQLVEGMSASFEEAEEYIRENLGKCYDPRLGYADYCGGLAYRFMLSTGEVIDAKPFINTRASVTVLMPDRSEKTVVGDFTVNGFRWRLNSDGRVLEIMPEHVLRVTNKSEAAERAAQHTAHDLYSGIGRLYREDPKRGCTGRPGFTVGTVDHAGAPRCPVHEAGVPDHLLT